MMSPTVEPINKINIKTMKDIKAVTAFKIHSAMN